MPRPRLVSGCPSIRDSPSSMAAGIRKGASRAGRISPIPYADLLFSVRRGQVRERQERPRATSRPIRRVKLFWSLHFSELLLHGADFLGESSCRAIYGGIQVVDSFDEFVQIFPKLVDGFGGVVWHESVIAVSSIIKI